MMETFIPDDFTFEQEQMRQMMNGCLFFTLGYFNFWVDLTWIVVSFLPMYANRVYLHGDSLGLSLLNAALM